MSRKIARGLAWDGLNAPVVLSEVVTRHGMLAGALSHRPTKGTKSFAHWDSPHGKFLRSGVDLILFFQKRLEQVNRYREDRGRIMLRGYFH